MGRVAPLPRRLLKIFDDTRATAVAATREEAPELVAEVGRLRGLAFAGEAEATGQSHGLDDHDDYYCYVVVVDKASGAMAAGTRLGFGREILSSRGWRALYTAGYWSFGDEMVRMARTGWRSARYGSTRCTGGGGWASRSCGRRGRCSSKGRAAFSLAWSPQRATPKGRRI